MKRFRRFFATHGFTLIELLIVIVILAILMAVAAPSFLGQTQKAQDSVAKQNLTLSWKAARSEAASNAASGGKYPSQTVLAGTVGSPGGAIQSDEPALTITPATSTDDGYTSASSAIKPSHIFVFSTSDNYTAYNHSASGKVFCITGDYDGQQIINSGNGCPGYVNTEVLPPANNALPTLTGPPYVGVPLALDPGSWSSNPTSYTYQWWVCDSGGIYTSEISGATSDTYTVAQPTGTYIGVKVIAINAAGSSVPAEAGCIGPVSTLSAPVNTDGPTITGNLYVGQTLTAHKGSWDNCSTCTYSYQWYDSQSGNGSYEIGSDSSTFALTLSQANENVWVRVTATNAVGSSHTFSTQEGPIINPSPQGLNPRPAISSSIVWHGGCPDSNGNWSTCYGDYRLDVTSNGTWRDGFYTPTVSPYHYQWHVQRDSATCEVPDNDSTVYYLSLNSTCWSIGSGPFYVWVTVTATNAYGSGNSSSSSISP